MYFDGDDIIVDERAAYDDHDALSRITARPDGRFVVCGWSWTWTAVDPADCDRIVGQIPAEGGHQEYVMLTHTDIRLPHDR